MLKVPDKRLALQAYEQILDLILTAGLKPGALINERRMAEDLDMSRTPVRDALLMLEGEGLLTRQGRVLQVRRMQIEEYMDALQVRMLLEPAVARMAAGRVPEDVVLTLRGRLEDLLTLGSGQRAERALVRDIDEQLHGALCEAAGNSQLSRIIMKLRRQTQIFDLRSLPERLTDTCHEHLEILEAVSSGDSAAAARAMTAHLGQVRDIILKRLAHI